MHVAHFIQRFPPALGGSEAYFERLSRWRQSRGDCVTVWTSTALDLSAFWSRDAKQLGAGVTSPDGIVIRRYEPSHWFARRHLLKLLSFVPSARWQCLTMTCNPIALRMAYDAMTDEKPCDLVHASALPYGWPLYWGLQLARRKKAPFLLTPFLHLGDPDNRDDRTRRIYTSKPMRYLMQAADAVFAQTALEREVIIGLGVQADRVILQGMGVASADCTGGDRARARSHWQVDLEACVVGHLANLSPEKGTIDLLRALRRAWERGARFRLILAGPMMPGFNQYWRQFQPKQNVTLTGPLSDNEKRDFFAGIDAFCLPSRSDSFGLVLLEAWANAKPNIGYRAGGIAEIIHHGDDGLLVKCGDIEGLCQALIDFEQVPGWRESLGLAGHNRIDREFRWADKLAVVDKAMDRLCQGTARASLRKPTTRG